MANCFSQPCWKRPAGKGPLWFFHIAGAKAFISLSVCTAKIRSGAPVVRRILGNSMAKTARICSNSRATLRASCSLPLVRTRKLGLRTSVRGLPAGKEETASDRARIEMGPMNLKRAQTSKVIGAPSSRQQSSSFATRSGKKRERFLDCTSRLLRRSEGGEKASACSARNDRDVRCRDVLGGLFSGAGEFAQGNEEAVYFFGGVVVDQADAEEAAGGLD